MIFSLNRSIVRPAFTLLYCALFPCVVLSEPSFAASEPRSIEKASKIIIKGLEKKITCRTGKEYAVGFHPFRPEKTPLSPSVADLLHREILAVLTQDAPKCVTFISVTGAGEVLDAMNRVNALSGEGVSRIEKIEKGLQEADFTLISNMFELKQQAFAELSLSDQLHGKSIVNSGAITVPERFQGGACGDGGLDFGAAITDIALHFRTRFSKVPILVPVGISYQNSDALTDFSVYLSDSLNKQLADAYYDRVLGKGLIIKQLDDSNFDEVRKLTGQPITTEQVEQTRLKIDGSKRESIFHISGHYWPCENDRRSVNLSVTMKNWRQESSTWQKFVHLNSLPQSIRLVPPKKEAEVIVSDDEWDAPAEFSFNLSSNKGRKPSFKAGEELFLLVHTDRDAWLYCFYTGSDGTMVQFLPNQTQDQTDPYRNFFARQVMHIVPDHNKRPTPDNYNLRINDHTLGIEAVKCIATSRDVTAELPKELQGKVFEILPRNLVLGLREIFEGLPNMVLAERNLTISVRN